MEQPLKIRPRPQEVRTRRRLALDAAAWGFGILGAAVLVVRWGFYEGPFGLSPLLLDVLLAVAAAGLLAERSLRMLLARQRRSYLREHWLDLLPLAMAVGMLLSGHAWSTAAGAYIPVSLIVHGGFLLRLAVGSGIPPARLLAGSFAACILLGAGLLCLPRAAAAGVDPIGPLDALFTATSATCVTGLIVRDTGGDFSRFGQMVILAMIQLGGLGLMTFGTLFIMLSGRRMGLRQSAVVREMISEENYGGIVRTVRFILASTFLIEFFGALTLHGLWRGQGDAWHRAVFHSISAFCNAGFALQADSFISLRDAWRVQAAVPALIILGGLGFPVLMNLMAALPQACRYLLRSGRRVVGRPRPSWTLQTRLVLTTTALLLALGWAALLALELGARHWGASFDGPLVGGCWFQSVSARTAGFNTIDLTTLSTGGRLWMILLMIIGGSPASTAGGMKTMCVAVTALMVWSVLRGREHVEVFGRTIPTAMARRAVTLAALFVGMVVLTALLLAAAQPAESDPMSLLFEAASACGTVGLSLGETARLTVMGKWVVMAAMFAGRVGPLTLLMSLAVNVEKARYSYPTESIVVG